MTLPYDYSGEDVTKFPPKKGDGDIVGPAGQVERATAKPSSPSTAPWGGISSAEDTVQEVEKTVKIGGEPVADLKVG